MNNFKKKKWLIICLKLNLMVGKCVKGGNSFQENKDLVGS